MKPIEDCVVGIVGLGLMGGAVAMALRPLKPAKILALEADRLTLDAAKADGVIDDGWLAGEEGGEQTAAMLNRCDLVFLCLNPATLIRFIGRWMGAFRSGSLITDIAGIKGNIVAAVERTLRPDLDFIPGHPMAGSEKGGFAQAKRCSFQGKNYILTPLTRNKRENLDFLKALIHGMGFGRITETTAEEHDRKIAFTSQLCHVIAAALIDCEADKEITRFGGGSFEDLTRIAMLNAPMWTELFLENKTELLRRIEQFEGSLDALKTLISGDQGEALEQRLGTVRDRRAAMN
ncbi:prephenate dehydrogenase [Treponema primitia]|uniref:prephenate dehydrogenase n=1 Tax=Treponema primitia TaxID=88058 RepID=UPI00025551A4|nr:prephenate dehydrogenase [Treponema primitia]